jgi:hypothetical protein
MFIINSLKKVKGKIFKEKPLILYSKLYPMMLSEIYKEIRDKIENTLIIVESEVAPTINQYPWTVSIEAFTREFIPNKVVFEWVSEDIDGFDEFVKALKKEFQIKVMLNEDIATAEQVFIYLHK